MQSAAVIPPPRVSVALVTYNGAAFVAEQVRSVLDQTVPPDELVVRDDGSTDGTVQEVRAATAGRADVRVVEADERGGVLRNVEACLRETRGDLVALSDQDDVWRRDKLQLVLEHFRDPEVMAVFSDARLVDETGAVLGGRLWKANRWSPPAPPARSVVTLDVLLRGNVVTGATLVVRRSVLELALPLPDHYHDAWLALVAAATGVVVAEPEPLVDYRLHGSNVTGLSGARGIGAVKGRLAVLGRSSSRGALAEQLLDRTRSASSPETQHFLQRQVDYFQRRAALPSSRLRRLPEITRLLLGGRYREHSRGPVTAVVDLVVPASVLREPWSITRGW